MTRAQMWWACGGCFAAWVIVGCCGYPVVAAWGIYLESPSPSQTDNLKFYPLLGVFLAVEALTLLGCLGFMYMAVTHGQSTPSPSTMPPPPRWMFWRNPDHTIKWKLIPIALIAVSAVPACLGCAGPALIALGDFWIAW